MLKILKTLLEFIPLVAFLLAREMYDIIYATKVLMAVSLVSAVLSLLIYRKMLWGIWISTILVLILGSVTVFLNDAMFIKIKPTILYSCFSIGLFIALKLNKLLIKKILSPVFDMDDGMWRKLTIAWILFFLSYAGLNEIVWRNFHEDIWIKFKVFGMFPIMTIFMIMQMIVFKKHLRH